jgi:outer membrane protein OmpA-like peptidoglycan-associated protein
MMNWNWKQTMSAAAVAGCLCMTAAAQNAAQTSTTGSTSTAPSSTTTATATGQKPLEMQSHEGFWGHMNPMARKKWVDRQTAPIKGRLNELDELTAKNATDIHDLDVRAQAGIKLASDTANTANQTALTANTTATTAKSEADQANSTAGQLTTTVSSLDQYQSVTDAQLRFRAGTTTLGPKAKEALDQMADQLQGQKGYILQVQGYSRTRGSAGVAASNQMADAVVRYLVEKKNVPLYRIYKMGYGSARPAGTDIPSGSVVEVTLMHNSLAALDTTGNGGSAIGATQPSSSAPSPGTTASQPNSPNQ